MVFNQTDHSVPYRLLPNVRYQIIDGILEYGCQILAISFVIPAGLSNYDVMWSGRTFETVMWD